MSIRTRSESPASSQQVGIANFLLALAAVGVAVAGGAWYALRDGSSSAPPAPGVVEGLSNPSFVVSNVRMPETIFIVQGESHRASAETDIEAAARIRHSTGVEAAKESVVVLASDEELRVFAQTVETNNSALASLGLEGDVIVDLRPR